MKIIELEEVWKITRAGNHSNNTKDSNLLILGHRIASTSAAYNFWKHEEKPRSQVTIIRLPGIIVFTGHNKKGSFVLFELFGKRIFQLGDRGENNYGF